MEVGDLVMTHNGNLVMIVELCINKSWANILFCESGNFRTGFPIEWLRRLKCK